MQIDVAVNPPVGGELELNYTDFNAALAVELEA